MVAAGTLVLPNAVIDLVVSKSGIAVPDVVNQAQGTAAAAITGAGLVVGTVRQRNSGTVPAGSVISQDPGAGTQVLPWSAVNLLVSLGPVIVAGEGEGEGTNANAAREQLAAAFASADKNGDQQLSFAEAAAVVPDLSQAVFDEIDTNEDGQLSPDELGADQGSGCAACQGGKGAFQPADWGARLSDLFLMSLALVGLAALRRL